MIKQHDTWVYQQLEEHVQQYKTSTTEQAVDPELSSWMTQQWSHVRDASNCCHAIDSGPAPFVPHSLFLLRIPHYMEHNTVSFWV